jgi:hypothetical protein
MASARIKLDPQTVEAIARRVIELLHGKAAAAGPELVDAAELARRLGVERSWVYTHAIELGAIELGGGRRPRLRFDPNVAAMRIRASAGRNGQVASKPRRLTHSHGERAGNRQPLLPIKGGGES